MKFGFAQADITPKGGKVSLVGQFHLRITDDVHDALHATAMVIVSENARTVWVSADTLWICKGVSDITFEHIKKYIPDLKEEEFVLSATHIHTGPNMWNDTYTCLTGERNGDPEGTVPSIDLAHQFGENIALAVKEAFENLKEAHFDLSIARIQTGVCRRVVYKDGEARMYGNPNTPDFLKMEGRDGGPVQLLYVYDENDKLFGIVANAPCTAQCDEGAVYITSDYWGVVRERILKEYGEGVKLFPLCRSAGDLSPHQIVDKYPFSYINYPSHSHDAAEAVGNRMADTIIKFKDKAVAHYGSEAKHNQGMRTVMFPIWKPTRAEYEWAKAYWDGPDRLNEQGKPRDSFKNSNAFTMIERYNKRGWYYPCNIYAASIGDIVFLSNPFELFIEYADRIRMACADKIVFDAELTHDCMGYLPTRAAVRGGGYSALMFNSVCNPDGGDVLVEESIALIKEVSK